MEKVEEALITSKEKGALEEKDLKDRNERAKVSTSWSIFHVIITLSIYQLLYMNWIYLPPVPEIDDSNPTQFNPKSAQNYLKEITKVGPRVGGSRESEIITVNLLKSMIENITSQALPIHKLDVEVQKAYGHHNIPLKFGYPLTVSFRGVQNIIVKLTANEEKEPDNYILLNSHFDTVPYSPGAGDDACQVATMLEILRKMTQSSLIHKHGIVFLFNGFEENNLQGSIAFVKYHRWFQKVRMVVNMEAGSNTGSTTLAQVGPKYPFLLDYYNKNFKRPSATALLEELFQAGFVISASDYEIFYKYGYIPGMDIAYYKYGYQYHTKYDTYEKIPLESLYNTGQSIMHMAHGLANAPEISNMKSNEGEKSVFYDYVNLILIKYSDFIASILHSLMLIFSVAILFTTFVVIGQKDKSQLGQISCEFILSLIVLVMSIAVGALLSILMSVAAHKAGKPMFWFTSTWLIFGVYCMPFLIAISLGPLLYIRMRSVKDLNVQSRVIIFLSAEHLIHILILLILTAFGTQVSYLFSLTTFAYSITNFINLLFKFKKSYWILIHLLGQLISFSYIITLALTLFSTLIPTSARGDGTTDQDQRMAIFGAITVFLLFGFTNALVSLLKRPYVVISLMVVFFGVSVFLATTPIGFPFRETTNPQRYYTYHSERIFYNLDGTERKHDSKVHMHPQDRLTPYTIMDVVPEMKNATLLGDECNTEVYCGIPFYMNRHYKQTPITYWIPFGPPDFPFKPELTLVGKQTFGPVTRFNFTIKGTDRMGIYISPVSGCTLVGWTFDEVLPSGPKWNGRSVHYVNYVHGIDNSAGTFYLDIEHPMGHPVDEARMNLALVANYMHHSEYRTEEYKKFLSAFPPFIYVNAHISSYQNWEF